MSADERIVQGQSQLDWLRSVRDEWLDRDSYDDGHSAGFIGQNGAIINVVNSNNGQASTQGRIDGANPALAGYERTSNSRNPFTFGASARRAQDNNLDTGQNQSDGPPALRIQHGEPNAYHDRGLTENQGTLIFLILSQLLFYQHFLSSPVEVTLLHFSIYTSNGCKVFFYISHVISL